jgi:branched-chain amino acid transport system ATP-binding protein
LFFEVNEIRKSFGGLVAVASVTFAVKEGGVTSVIGPNGAGKTTLFNLITGVIAPDEGDIYFKNQKITGKPPHRLYHLGLSRSFQVTNIFQGLTAFENIRLACQGKNRSLNLFGSISQLSKCNDEARRILELLGLQAQSAELAGNLSHGDQRCLEIGIALAAQPAMLLLDEPTAGMTALETRTTIDLIGQLRTRVTILLIEHDVDMVLELSDRIIVMQQGQILTEGSPDEVKANADVQKAYFGEEI